MKRALLRLMMVCFCATGGAAVAAELTLFEDDHFTGRRFNIDSTAPNLDLSGLTFRASLYDFGNFGGRSFPINDNVPNLDGTGFNDRASSLRVERGYWLFCSGAQFQGECRTFGPGDYPRLPSGLNNTLSSGRKISDDYPYNQPPNWGRR